MCTSRRIVWGTRPCFYGETLETLCNKGWGKMKKENKWLFKCMCPQRSTLLRGEGMFQTFPNPYTLCGHIFPLPFKNYLLSNYWKTYNLSIYFLKLPVALPRVWESYYNSTFWFFWKWKILNRGLLWRNTHAIGV